jgi:hypothetical protein
MTLDEYEEICVSVLGDKFRNIADHRNGTVDVEVCGWPTDDEEKRLRDRTPTYVNLRFAITPGA